jgi:hypothetical protein
MEQGTSIWLKLLCILVLIFYFYKPQHGTSMWYKNSENSISQRTLKWHQYNTINLKTNSKIDDWMQILAYGANITFKH